MSSTTGHEADRSQGEAPVEGRAPRGEAEVAHDLNNVLTSILGYAEIIAEDARSGTVAARDADQLLAATRQAVALVKVLRASPRSVPIAPDETTAIGGE